MCLPVDMQSSRRVMEKKVSPPQQSAIQLRIPDGIQLATGITDATGLAIAKPRCIGRRGKNVV